MAHKLGDPGHNLDRNGGLVGAARAHGREVVRERGPAEDQGEQCRARDGFKQDVEGAVDQGGDGAQVEGEVWDCEP